MSSSELKQERSPLFRANMKTGMSDMPAIKQQHGRTASRANPRPLPL
ncbi:hypothetical protein RDV84_04155 [Lysobacter yananisis]|uniref:Uncharacterized protein n=2 Tax=Lysobacter TaxID=68 RepID=A0A0S2DB80_LYSEN|nr:MULTISPECIES: hypothetical protein [Lysobacter]ALN55797.1 hypothetical protein GLE_0439 [Lysobacter enzymogenes]WMT04052.1 hypothetical protein RDV84_04155 [Lysobacter yananisis]